MSSRWLTPAQAAEFICVSKRCLARWRDQVSGPPFSRKGKIVRYDSVKLQAWMERSEVRTAS